MFKQSFSNFYKRYYQLQELLQKEIITSEEHQELLCLNDLIETKNVERLELLIRLAQLRGVSLDMLMKDLEIDKV